MFLVTRKEEVCFHQSAVVLGIFLLVDKLFVNQKVLDVRKMSSTCLCAIIVRGWYNLWFRPEWESWYVFVSFTSFNHFFLLKIAHKCKTTTDTSDWFNLVIDEIGEIAAYLKSGIKKLFFNCSFL